MFPVVRINRSSSPEWSILNRLRAGTARLDSLGVLVCDVDSLKLVNDTACQTSTEDPAGNLKHIGHRL